MFSIFFSLGNFSKIWTFFSDKFFIIWKNVHASSNNFSFRMESIVWHNYPSESIFDLDLETRTVQFSNCCSRSKSLWTDWISSTKTVVSLAYWVIFIELFGSIWISSISFENLSRSRKCEIFTCYLILLFSFPM